MNLFRTPPAPVVTVTVAAPVPFRPFNAEFLTPDQVRDALKGTGQSIPVAAMVQLFEAQIGIAIAEMAAGVPGAAGAYRMLREYYEGVTEMLRKS